VALLGQGARFHEFLGYTLAVLSIGILCAGIVWALRVHVSKRYRMLFVIGSFAALCPLSGGALTLLILTQPLLPETIQAQPPPPSSFGFPRAEPAEELVNVEVYLKPDGTLVYEDQENDAERLVKQLRQTHPDKRLNVTIYVDAETKLDVAITALSQLQKNGVEQLAFRVRE
jgi:biopolymer transport protein ExbD